jgi:glycosyltransferase involved in cell wall biosynthesis
MQSDCAALQRGLVKCRALLQFGALALDGDRPMNILCVHQNLPGQYQQVIGWLLGRGHSLVGMSLKAAPVQHPRYRHVTYAEPAQPHAAASPHAQTYAADCARGFAVLKEARRLRDEGFVPDLILAHTGWGEAMFLKDAWPEAPLLGYFEYWYTAKGGAVDYDPEFPASAEMPGIMRARNATNLVSLDACDHGQTATEWQRSGYPGSAQSRITAIHEGIRTEICRPNPDVSVRLGRVGDSVTREDEVFTFMARNMEPTRGFHVFMRALPEILAARPKARCLLIGGNKVSYGREAPGGSWRAVMEQELGDQLDWDRIHFLGRLPYEIFVACMQLTRCHVYLTVPFVPSWSLLEAMACGAPVVASDVAPVREVTGGCVRYVPFAQHPAVAQAVIETLQMRSADRSDLGLKARRHIVQTFDAKEICLPALTGLMSRVSQQDV